MWSDGDNGGPVDAPRIETFQKGQAGFKSTSILPFYTESTTLLEFLLYSGIAQSHGWPIVIPSFIPSQFVSPHARALSASHLSLSYGVDPDLKVDLSLLPI